MHHGAAVRRLRTIAEGCDQLKVWPPDAPILHSAYAFGTVFENLESLDFVQVAFVLDLPTDELTWGVRPRACSWLSHELRLDRTPVDGYWRPLGWPVSNHVIRRPLRIWTLDGPDEAALAAPSRREAEPLRLPAPSHEELAAQLATELAGSLEYLRRVRDGFWEREWRAEHKGDGIYPEHHLWDATRGYLDLLEAVEAHG